MTVFYDLADPQQAFLQKGYGAVAARIVLTVVLIMVLAIVALLVLTKGFS